LSDISKLSSAEKAKRYRQLAERARRNAASGPNHLKDAYLRIARQWDDLAAITETLAERAKQSSVLEEAVARSQAGRTEKK